MTEVMLGLRSNLGFATEPAAGETASRAKLFALLFDHVLVEAGALHCAPLSERVAVRRRRATPPGHVPGAFAERDGFEEEGVLTAGFDGLIETLRTQDCVWAGAYVSPPGAKADEDIADGLGVTPNGGSVSGWLRGELATDLTIARRLRAALAPGAVASAELSAAEGVAISQLAAVCPDPGGVPWEQIEVLREDGAMRALQRLVREMLSIARRADSDTSLATFDELSQDVGDVMWDILGEAGHRPGRAITFRLAVPAHDSVVPWTAVLLSPHELQLSRAGAMSAG